MIPLPLLLAALSILPPALYLPLLGARSARPTAALGAGIIVGVISWIVLINAEGANGYLNDGDRGEAKSSGLLIWGVSAGVGTLAAFIAAIWAAPIGMACVAVLGGATFGAGICMMGNDGTIPSAAGRWGFIAAMALASLCTMLRGMQTSMAVNSALAGSFFLVLFIDLFVNGYDGMSQGLRVIGDRNPAHHDTISSFHPPTVTRALIAVSWALSIPLCFAQLYLWKKRRDESDPFISSSIDHRTAFRPPLWRQPSSLRSLLYRYQPTADDKEKNLDTEEGGDSARTTTTLSRIEVLEGGAIDPDNDNDNENEKDPSYPRLSPLSPASTHGSAFHEEFSAATEKKELESQRTLSAESRTPVPSYHSQADGGDPSAALIALVGGWHTDPGAMTESQRALHEARAKLGYSGLSTPDLLRSRRASAASLSASQPAVPWPASGQLDMQQDLAVSRSDRLRPGTRSPGSTPGHSRPGSWQQAYHRLSMTVPSHVEGENDDTITSDENPRQTTGSDLVEAGSLPSEGAATPRTRSVSPPQIRSSEGDSDIPSAVEGAPLRPASIVIERGSAVYDDVQAATAYLKRPASIAESIKSVRRATPVLPPAAYDGGFEAASTSSVTIYSGWSSMRLSEEYPVRLVNLTLSNLGGRVLSGEIVILASKQSRKVFARVTQDAWRSGSEDIPAIWQNDTVTTEDQTVATFSFDLRLKSDAALAEVEMACMAEGMNGEAWWDNVQGENYRIGHLVDVAATTA